MVHQPIYDLENFTGSNQGWQMNLSALECTNLCCCLLFNLKNHLMHRNKSNPITARKFDSLELVVGLDELLNERLASLRVGQHRLQRLPHLNGRLFVQQNQI